MKPELILPGGDLERVKIAFAYGADAVYVGINKHSLRKAEIRFDVAEVGEAIAYAHSLGKRLFVTFNIFAHNKQLADIEKDMKAIAAFGPDAFIMADLGVINLAKKVAPDVAIHVSTQANTVNIEDVRFWRDFGAKRVVLARELSLDEIREIHLAVPEIELEAFVHGSMCISYSGRCLMSNYMTSRDANRGECAQPCRWNYNVYSDKPQTAAVTLSKTKDPSLDSSCGQNDENYYLEEKNRPGEYFPIEETETGTNIMSSKDLAAIEILPDILDAGVMGLKIEGRNKSEYYLASVGYAYRHALDSIKQDKYTDKLKSTLMGELQKINNRDYTTGFYHGDAKAGETYEGRAPIRKWDYVGQIIDNDGTITVKNKLSTGDTVEILVPDELFAETIISIKDLNGNNLDEINPGRADQQAMIELSRKYTQNSFIRKEL
jgi:U32 family peptidase